MSHHNDIKDNDGMKHLKQTFCHAWLGLLLLGGSTTFSVAHAIDIALKGVPRVTQKLVAPPFVPKHSQTTPSKPRVVKVTMVIKEKIITIDDAGTKMWAMTYEGSVPGPLIVVHENDYVELTLKNPKSNQLLHNVDFHAATGALGGGALTVVAPGQTVVLRFKATRPGVFVYHCAPGGPMIPWHVVSGMNGAIMVLPKGGLKDGKGKRLRYTRAYYIGEQDYYIPKNAQGDYRKVGASPAADLSSSLKAMRTLIPSHVVFNGRAGALTGKAALKSKVGETVLFIHAQSNRDSRPHLIGGHGDYVWETGSFNDAPATNLETWFIRGGSAGAMLYTFRQPGLYVYLNHNLIEAMMLGAAAHINVAGKWNDDLMTVLKKPGESQGKGGY